MFLKAKKSPTLLKVSFGHSKALSFDRLRSGSAKVTAQKQKPMVMSLKKAFRLLPASRLSRLLIAALLIPSFHR